MEGIADGIARIVGGGDQEVAFRIAARNRYGDSRARYGGAPAVGSGQGGYFRVCDALYGIGNLFCAVVAYANRLVQVGDAGEADADALVEGEGEGFRRL